MRPRAPTPQRGIALAALKDACGAARGRSAVLRPAARSLTAAALDAWENRWSGRRNGSRSNQETGPASRSGFLLNLTHTTHQRAPVTLNARGQRSQSLHASLPVPHRTGRRGRVRSGAEPHAPDRPASRKVPPDGGRWAWPGRTGNAGIGRRYSVRRSARALRAFSATRNFSLICSKRA